MFGAAVLLTCWMGVDSVSGCALLSLWLCNRLVEQSLLELWSQWCVSFMKQCLSVLLPLCMCTRTLSLPCFLISLLPYSNSGSEPSQLAFDRLHRVGGGQVSLMGCQYTTVHLRAWHVTHCHIVKTHKNTICRLILIILVTLFLKTR